MKNPNYTIKMVIFNLSSECVYYNNRIAIRKITKIPRKQRNQNLNTAI